jgi:hypothetical protein
VLVDITDYPENIRAAILEMASGVCRVGTLCFLASYALYEADWRDPKQAEIANRIITALTDKHCYKNSIGFPLFNLRTKSFVKYA